MRKIIAALVAFVCSAGIGFAQGQLPSGNVWANSGASAGQAQPTSVTALFNRALCGTQNNIIIRGASTWGCGTVSSLLSNGTGITLSGTTVVTVTLASTAVTPASYGSATQCVALTINQQGQITAAAATTCTPAFSSITGLSANTVLGSVAGGNASALTQTQLTSLCNAFTTSLSGCVPASGGGTTNFLRADGTWAGGAVAGVASIAGNTGAFTLNGTSGLTNSVNDIKCSAASSSQFGCVEVDNVTVLATAGVIGQKATTLTNSLSGNVALNNTASFFDGPSVAQGTSGTWLAAGSVRVIDSGGAALMGCKLWDGTTVIASAAVNTTSATNGMQVGMSGVLASPAGNIRISCQDQTATTGVIGFNASGASKDSTVTVVRIQ